MKAAWLLLFRLIVSIMVEGWVWSPSIFSIFNFLNIQYSQYSIFFIMVEGWVWSPSFLNQLSSVVNTVTMSLDDSHYLYIFCVYSFISLKDSVCSIALVYCVCIYQSQKCWITYQVDLQVLEDQYIWWAYKPIDDHRGILFTTNIFPPFLVLAHAGSRAFLFSDNIHITAILAFESDVTQVWMFL